MSRFYDIQVGGYHWTSHPGGPGSTRDPGALNIEMDITETPSDASHGTGFLRVYGAGDDVAANAQQLANQQITVQAGMGGGLPLADSSRSGQIAGGLVNQLDGYIEGTTHALDFYITVGGYGTPTNLGPHPKSAPLDFTLNWQKGQPLGPALTQALQQGAPGFQVMMAISDQLVAPQTQLGTYNNIFELGQYVRQMSQQILGPNSPGVSIVPNGNTFNVSDGSQAQQSGQIQVQDLVGLPTWKDVNTLVVKTVLYNDVRVGQTISMPQGVLISGQISQGPITNLNSYAGSFLVSSVRYVGNFRGLDGSSWCRIITATANTQAS